MIALENRSWISGRQKVKRERGSRYVQGIGRDCRDSWQEERKIREPGEWRTNNAN